MRWQHAQWLDVDLAPPVERRPTMGLTSNRQDTAFRYRALRVDASPCPHRGLNGRYPMATRHAG